MRFIFLILLMLLPYSTTAEETKKEYSIAEFKSTFRPEGTYTIRAYVAEVFECPPCPTGALCEPCNDVIVLSDKNTGRCSKSKLCLDELILYPRDADTIAEAKRAGKLPYLTTIQISSLEVREMRSAEENVSKSCTKDSDCVPVGNSCGLKSFFGTSANSKKTFGCVCGETQFGKACTKKQ